MDIPPTMKIILCVYVLVILLEIFLVDAPVTRVSVSINVLMLHAGILSNKVLAVGTKAFAVHVGILSISLFSVKNVSVHRQ